MMGPRFRSTLLMAVVAGCAMSVRAQVFTVGEKTATADIKTDFKPTHVELPDVLLSERGRRELVRDLDAEQGFAHRVLPLGVSFTLMANGRLTPGDEDYKKVIYKKGQSASPGDRVAITSMQFKRDSIVIDLNGGPYPPHRFMRHIQLGVGGAMTQQPTLDEQATGCRIILAFEGGVPELTAPEVKALLEPVVDFKVKTGEQAYAETLPTPIKSAIQSHEVLVGMSHRMVLAAMGAPENKVRESNDEGSYEEWIYGHQPQPVQFVRFVGDRVSLVKVASLGKPIEVRNQDEMAGYRQAPPTRAVLVSNAPVVDEKHGAPSLRLPGDEEPAAASQNAERKVQFPQAQRDAQDRDARANNTASAPTLSAPSPGTASTAPSIAGPPEPQP